MGLPAEAWYVLPLATAAGLDLHLSLLFLGASVRLGWEAALPDALEGLHTVPVVLAATAFYLVETAAERSAPGVVFWNVLQSLVRPVASGLLALLLLEGAPWSVRLGAAALAAAVTLAVHAVRVGGHLVLRLSRARRRTRLIAAAAEDVMALSLCVLLLEHPRAATLVAAVLLLGALPQARAHLDGFAFGLRAGWARSWGMLRESGWRDPTALPAWVRRAVADDPRFPGGPLRGSPAASARLPGSGLFVHGWVVVTGSTPLFVRRRGGDRLVPLEATPAPRVFEGFLDRRMEAILGGAGRGPLHFPPDGPSREALEAEFQATPGGRSRGGPGPGGA